MNVEIGDYVTLRPRPGDNPWDWWRVVRGDFYDFDAARISRGRFVEWRYGLGPALVTSHRHADEGTA